MGLVVNCLPNGSCKTFATKKPYSPILQRVFAIFEPLNTRTGPCVNFVYGMFYYSSMAKRGYALVKKLSLGRHGTKQARPDGSKNHVKELLLAISVSAVGAATLAACGSSSSAGRVNDKVASLLRF